MMKSCHHHWSSRLLLLSLLGLSGCSPDFSAMAEKRLEFARQNLVDIEIVAIEETAKSSYIRGIKLATELINQRPEKLLGRSLKLTIKQAGKDLDDSKTLFRQIAANPKVTAVLGHRKSSIAIPASVIYERSQIIFMPPFSTAKKLTGHTFNYVFRMMPNNEIMAEQQASAAKILGYQKMVMLYTRDDFSREQAFLFEDAAINQQIKLIQRISFFAKETNYRPIISEFSSEDFDAIFIASSAEPAAKIVKQLREMGITKPILGNDSLNNTNYYHVAGKAANNTIIPSIYKIDRTAMMNNDFIQHYQKRYETIPSYQAAQGYDSVMLLSAAIERAGSTIPSLLSSTLHYMPAWVGITGINGYDKSGELTGKKYFFKVWQGKQWHYLPALHIPYLLERFRANRLNNTPPPSKKVTDFLSVFSKRMHEDDHKTALLDLAYEILQFKRIGIIFENTKEGRKAAGYEIVKTLVDKKKISVEECEIPFSLMTKKEIEQAIIACYGKLSLNMDVFFVSPYYGINPVLIQRLNKSLSFFKIPSLSFNERNVDPNITLVLSKRSDVVMKGKSGMHVYGPLLNGLKVHEFSERMKGLPELMVNLVNLQRYGRSDKAILQLSPDNYLYADTSPLQKKAEP